MGNGSAPEERSWERKSSVALYALFASVAIATGLVAKHQNSNGHHPELDKAVSEYYQSMSRQVEANLQPTAAIYTPSISELVEAFTNSKNPFSKDEYFRRLVTELYKKSQTVKPLETTDKVYALGVIATPTQKDLEQILALATPAPTATPYTLPIDSRVKDIPVNDGDVYLLAQLIQAEAGGDSYIGKLAVGRVVVLRMLDYGQTLQEVIFAPGQFSPAKYLGDKTPSGSSIQTAQDALINGLDPFYGKLSFHFDNVNHCPGIEILVSPSGNIFCP